MASQRDREIGIHLPSGARFRHVAGLIYRSALLPSAFGLVLGARAAVWLTRLLKSFLFGVTTSDLTTLTLAGLTLLVSAILAATGPAVRAAGNDPARLLHRD